jgi:hypothetical protein
VSLVAALRASSPSQPNTVTEIRYSSRNSTGRDPAITTGSVHLQLTVLHPVLARYTITGIFLDEVQVSLEERAPIKVQDKMIPAGQYIGELLTWLAKKGPAAGIVLVLATQRPDTKPFPPPSARCSGPGLRCG